MEDKININFELGEAGKALVEKVANAVGVIYDPTGVKEGEREFSKIILEDIARNEGLSIEEKVLALNEFKFCVAKNKNRKEVIQKAQGYLLETASPREISDSWIMTYWEKIGNAAELEFQEMWARVLAQEANYPNTVSKRLMYNLALMGKQDAENFLNLTRFCFYDKSADLVHPIIFIRENSVAYADSRITTERLRELEQFGLIEINYETGFSFKKKKILRYMNSYIEVSAPRIHVGNVRLTEDGQTLFKIVEKQNHEQIMQFTIQKLEAHGCEVKLIRK